MANQKHQFTTPVGRLVGGSLYEAKTTDYDGNPLVVKTGPNAGQPRKEYGFSVAFAKTPGATHWAQEAWLTPLYHMAAAAFPNGEFQRPDFAWKITDGDSTVPKKGKNGQPGRRPCDLEGHAGHWVVYFSGGQAPKVYNANGTQQILEPDAVKRGYYVQVFGNAADNKPSASPGLYINHSMIAFAAYGEEISYGPDVSAAGFGNAALPPGASAAPLAGAFNPATLPPPVAAPVPIPGAVMPPVPVPVPNPAAFTPPVPVPVPVAAPVPVVPNPAILAVPVPPAPVRQLTAAAAGATYEQLISAGWTDATLVQHGMMLG